MGYFSSKKVYTSDVVTSPLVSNDELPDYNLMLGIHGIKHPDGYISAYKDFIMDGPIAKAKSMYNLASSDPLLGIPRSFKTLASVDLTNAIQTSLNTKFAGYSPTLSSYYLSTILLDRANPEGFAENYFALRNCVFLNNSVNYSDSFKYSLDVDATEVGVVHPLIKHDSEYEFSHYIILPPPQDQNISTGGNPIDITYFRYEGIYCRTYSQEGATLYSKNFYVDYVLLNDEAAALPVETLLDYVGRLQLRRDGKIAIRKNGVTFESESYNLLKEDIYAIALFELEGTSRVAAFNVTSPTGSLTDTVFRDEMAINSEGYMPIVPLRQDWEWVEDNPNAKANNYPFLNGKKPTKQQVFRSTKKLLKKVGMDLQELLDILQSTDEGNDPTIMRSVYLGYFVDVVAPTQVSKQYLYEYFSFLETQSEFNKSDYDNWTANEWNRTYTWVEDPGTVDEYTHTFNGIIPNAPTGSSTFGLPNTQFYNDLKLVRNASPLNVITVQDNLYSLDLLYNYITKTVYNGVIGDVGEVGTITSLAPYRYYSESKANTQYLVLSGNDEEKHSRLYSFKDVEVISQDSLIFRKQINETQYEELIVHGLMHSYQPARGTAIIRTLKDAMNAASGNNVNLNKSVYVPLYLKQFKELNVPIHKKATLLADSLGFVIYAEDYVRVKWYQKQSFLSLVQFAVVVVFAIFSMPQVGAGVAGLIAFITDLVIQVLVTYLSKKVFEILIKELGLENTLIALVVATVIAITMEDTQLFTFQLSLFEGGLVGIGMSTLNVLGSAFAATMEVINDDLNSLKDEWERHTNYIETKQEELKNAQDLLGGSEELNYLLLSTRPKYILDKTPEDFYRRTSQLLDFPELQDNAISTYYDRKLDLDNMFI